MINYEGTSYVVKGAPMTQIERLGVEIDPVTPAKKCQPLRPGLSSLLIQSCERHLSVDRNLS